MTGFSVSPPRFGFGGYTPVTMCGDMLLLLLKKGSGGSFGGCHDGIFRISSSFWVRGVWGALDMLTFSCPPPRFSYPPMILYDFPGHFLLALDSGGFARNGYVDLLASSSSFWVRRRTHEKTTVRPAMAYSLHLRSRCHHNDGGVVTFWRSSWCLGCGRRYRYRLT